VGKKRYRNTKIPSMALKESQSNLREPKFFRSYGKNIVTAIGILLAIIPIIWYLQDQKKTATTGFINRKNIAQSPVISIGPARFTLKPPNKVLYQDRGKPLIGIKIQDNKLLLSAVVRDSQGDIISEIIDNEWSLNKDNHFDRNYSDSAIEIRDRAGRVVLQAVHLGDIINLTGILRCSDGSGWVLKSSDKQSSMSHFSAGENPREEIIPICNYPSDRHLGECPGIPYIEKVVSRNELPNYVLERPLELCVSAKK
jgi:hypothetical protein